jgi:catechol 2,3-dioxygenase-like lactoylglutathione lyase family enzyme
MQIIGPDTLVFAVPDLAEARKYLTDYGLVPAAAHHGSERFEALDGTGIEIAEMDDPRLPGTLGTENQLRLTVYGVTDGAALDVLADELADDPGFARAEDDSLGVVDPLGFALRFQISCRRPLAAPRPDSDRAVNQTAVAADFTPCPRTLSHFAYFVPDLAPAEAFYVDRLGFRVTDRLGGGPFLRPQACPEHHTMFLIKTPPFMKGMEHLAFHTGGPGEVMAAGSRFTRLGYESAWGPGRHIMGSNWFWYFKSPLGCSVEYDADMDRVDDGWLAREMPFHPDNAQAFLLKPTENWVPGGPPPGAGAH